MKPVKIDYPVTPSKKAHKERGTPKAVIMKFPKETVYDMPGLRASYVTFNAGKPMDPAAALPVREQRVFKNVMDAEKRDR